MKNNWIDIVVKSLKILNDQYVYLNNLGYHDVFDATQTLTIGLIWTLILRFQIENDSPNNTDVSKMAESASSLWNELKTGYYENLSILKLNNSLKYGLALNAIILNRNHDQIDGMRIAFNIADDFSEASILDDRILSKNNTDYPYPIFDDFRFKLYKLQIIQVDTIKITEEEMSTNNNTELDEFCAKISEIYKLIEIRLLFLENEFYVLHFYHCSVLSKWMKGKKEFLQTLVPIIDSSDLNEMKHNLYHFYEEMAVKYLELKGIIDVAKRKTINNHEVSLLHSIRYRRMCLEWTELVNLANNKQTKFYEYLTYNEFLIGCRDICSSIKEKMDMQLLSEFELLPPNIEELQALVTDLNDSSVNLLSVMNEFQATIVDEIAIVNELWKKLLINIQVNAN